MHNQGGPRNIDRRQKQAQRKLPEDKKKLPRQNKGEIATKPRQVVISPAAFSESVLRHWNNWSTQQKIAYVTIFLLTTGASLYAIYYLVPLLVESLNANLLSLSRQNYGVRQLRSSTSIGHVGIFSEKSKTTPEGVPVFCEPGLHKWLLDHPSADYKENALNSINDQINLIKKLLPKIIQPKILAKILVDPTFSIQVAHPNFLQGGRARFVGKENTVYIQWEFNLNDQEHLTILRNEFHSAAQRHRNHEKLIANNMPDDPKGLYESNPFLDEYGEKDQKMADDLHEAILAGDRRIQEFKMLFDKFLEKNINPEEKEKLYDYMDNIVAYEPRVHRIRLNDFQLEDMVKTGKVKRVKEGNIKYIFLKDINPGFRSDLYVREIAPDIDPSVIALKGTFAKNESKREKTKAFLEDHRLTRLRYEENGPYRLSRDDRNAEISSDLEEWSPKAFYPEWCDYFSRYHQEDYCAPFSP